MFNFNLKKTAIFKSLKWGREPVFKFAKSFKKTFFFLFIAAFLLFLYGFLFQNFSDELNRRLLGSSVIFLSLGLIFWMKQGFFNSKIKNPKLNLKISDAASNPQEYNLAEFLSFDSADVIDKTINFCKYKRWPEINSSALFYFLIKESPKLNFIFSRILLNPNDIRKLLESHFKILKKEKFTKAYLSPVFKEIKSENFQAVILESLKIAEKRGHARIETGDLIAALAKHNHVFKQIIIDSKLKYEDIDGLTWWLESLERKEAQRKRFWEWKNLIKKGSLAKEWSSGYTITLDKFSTDITRMVRKQGYPEIVGHREEIETMERVLSREESKNDVLIVGEAGSGRKSMITALAARSALGESLPSVNYKRIVQLDLTSLISQTDMEESENILETIFKEVVFAGNIILVIDELHNFIGSGTKLGTVDISGALSPYIQLPEFQVIGITTFEGLHKNIEKNASILALFEKIEASEASEQETLTLLKNLSLYLEKKHKKLISYPALREIIDYCQKYLPATPFPEKAIDLLEEVVVYASQTKEKIVFPKHVDKVVAEKTKIPVGELEVKEKEVLLDLENLLHQKIINQEKAVKEVSTALRRARAEITIKKRPIGSFLFLGPTGVGKTETSKALAEIYFGSSDRMIRIDMSEFQEVKDISRLIGSADEDGLLTTPVREKPFSLILLDEIEKAHPNILNLFLQILDEGSLTDGLGRKVDFKNTLIIGTSNAGYQVILKAIKEETEWSKIKSLILDFLFQEGTFRPEFINRFDAMVIFKPLTKENLLDIAGLLLQDIKKSLKKKDIEFVITQELKEKITELGYNPVFGAREMRRVIQDKVENSLAQAILSEKLTRGNIVEVDPETFQVKINP